MHGCQNPDLDPTILRFYDLTYPKRFKSFKDLCGHSGSVGSYDSDDPNFMDNVPKCECSMQ